MEFGQDFHKMWEKARKSGNWSGWYRVQQVVTHEGQHIDDFYNFPLLMYWGREARYWPGSGIARYIAEFRAWRAAGEYRNFMSPLKSMTDWKGPLALDIGIVSFFTVTYGAAAWYGFSD